MMLRPGPQRPAAPQPVPASLSLLLQLQLLLLPLLLLLLLLLPPPLLPLLPTLPPPLHLPPLPTITWWPVPAWRLTTGVVDSRLRRKLPLALRSWVGVLWQCATVPWLCVRTTTLHLLPGH